MRELKYVQLLASEEYAGSSTPAPTQNVITHKPLQVDGIFPIVKDVLWFQVNIMHDIKVCF